MIIYAAYVAMLLVSIMLRAAEFPFNLSDDKFTPIVVHKHEQLMGILLGAIDESNKQCPFSNVIREIANKNLNEQIEDVGILNMACTIYNNMISDEHVISSFKIAKETTQHNADSEICKNHWRTFKRTAIACLVDIRNTWLPEYVAPGVEGTVKNILDFNKNLILSSEQKNFFIAYNIVFHTIRQNKLLIYQMYQ